MHIPMYQVDAFTNRLFGGNPAAVCPLDAWLTDATMQAIAAENNLAETAFFIPRGDDYELRWFTPAIEVDLCGHATLASAYIVFTRLAPARSTVTFHTRSGALIVRRRGEGASMLLTMDFPSLAAESCDAPPALLESLGVTPQQVLRSLYYLVILQSEDAVRAVAPAMAGLAELDRIGVIVSAPGDDVDFVSRFFAPAAGIPEDPVTGSAHCILTPYWAARLGKTQLRARQISARIGDLECVDQGERVLISGRAVLYFEGTITI